MQFHFSGSSLFISLALVLANPVAGRAQDWVPLQGEGSVSILYQRAAVHDHLFSDGSRADVGHIHLHSLLFDIDYGLSDRLTVSASLPYVAASCKGPIPHVHERRGSLDDGAYHSTVQDLRLDLRYNAIELPFAITPFAAVNLPSHDYEFFAHSAVGLRLKEVQLGAYLGVVRAPLYVQGRYSASRYFGARARTH